MMTWSNNLSDNTKYSFDFKLKEKHLFYLLGSEHDLQWIPRNYAENVFILLSTLPGRVCKCSVYTY